MQNLHAMLAPFMLQRTKAEVLGDSLAKKREEVVRVPLSAWQTDVYKKLETKSIEIMVSKEEAEAQKLAAMRSSEALDNLDAANNDRRAATVEIKNVLMQMRKIVLHPFLFDDGESMSSVLTLTRTAGKFEYLDRVLRKLFAAEVEETDAETGKVTKRKHKVLLFSQFTRVIDLIEELLSQNFAGIKYGRIDGQVAASERHNLVQKFSNAEKNYQLMLLSSRAGGVGLNLQA